MRTETAGVAPPVASGSPVVAIRVELGSVLATLAEPGRGAFGRLAKQIERGVDAHLRGIGIPGSAAVEVAPCPTDRLLRILLNRLYYEPSDELFVLAWDRLAPLPTRFPTGYGFARWLTGKLTRDDAFRGSLPKLESIVAAVSSELVRRHARELVGEAQAVNLLARAPFLLGAECGEALGLLKPSRLVSILRPVLDVGISLANQGKVLETIAGALTHSRPEEEISETLIADFSTKFIRVRLGPEYLSALIPVPGQLEPGPDGRPSLSVSDPRISLETKKLFGQMRDQIFFELGVRLPEVVFETDPQCEGSTFQIALNDQFNMPRAGLEPGERLVNAPPQELPEAVAKEARESIAPPLDGHAAIVPEGHREALEQKGLTTWSPPEYIILSIAREAKRNAWRLMSTAAVETELALLDDTHPDLALAAFREITPGRLARVLRQLLREQVSIRDFVTILERLLTFDWVMADTLTTIVYDDRLAVHPRLGGHRENSEADLAQYVRLALKRAMIRKHTQGRNTISVFLLDPEFERTLLDQLAACRGFPDAAPLNADEIGRIRAAIRIQVEQSIVGSWAPAIVTSVSIRRFVRELVADELPDVPVFSYDEIELGPDFSAQPIAQIAMGEQRAIRVSDS